jgi:glycosyltransferase involved in cell wall biosynthesis
MRGTDVTTPTDTNLVSVVIAVYDRRNQLCEAVDSVLSQASAGNGAGVDVEVVIVDDGSTDGTAEVADDLAAQHDNVQVIHQANAGPSAARNVGVGVSSGHWLTFLDSDDLMMPGRLAAQVHELRRLGPNTVVIGEESVVVADGIVAPVPITLQLAKPRPHWYTMTMMTSRSVFDDVGGFDESLRMAEDTELLFRMKRRGVHIHRFEQVWTHRRIFGDNLVYGLGDDEAVVRSTLMALRMNLPSRPA